MPSEITPFQEYEVDGVGTVLEPLGEPGYRVRLLSGHVTGFAAQSGDPSEANAAADIAYALANPPVQAPTQQEIFDAQLALGYLDAPSGIKLKTIQRAQNRFTSMVTAIELALSVGAKQLTDEETIWDFADEPHVLPIANFRVLMLRYAAHCKAVHAEYSP